MPSKTGCIPIKLGCTRITTLTAIDTYLGTLQYLGTKIPYLRERLGRIDESLLKSRLTMSILFSRKSITVMGLCIQLEQPMNKI